MVGTTNKFPLLNVNKKNLNINVYLILYSINSYRYSW